jgi:hypothetical protein
MPWAIIASARDKSPDAAQRNPGISRRDLFPRISFHPCLLSKQNIKTQDVM